MAGGEGTQMDSGFSWVVLAASSLSMICLNLCSSSAGLLQVEIMEDLGVGSGVVSIMLAVSIGLGTLLGPLSGVLSTILTIRYTVFIGAFLLSFGFLATSFCHSVEAMMFFYSIVVGVGNGLTYCPCIVIISMYFDKRHIMANGILFCTPGVGMISIPYFVSYMIDTFGWRYCVAINGGILLNLMVFASFFVPTQAERRRMLKPSFCCYRTGDASINGSDVDDASDLETLSETKDDGPAGAPTTITTTTTTTTTAVGSPKEKEIIGAGIIIGHQNIQMLLKNGSCGDTHSLGSARNLAHNLHKTGKRRRPYTPIYINGTPETKSFLHLPHSPVTDLIASESSFNGFFNSVEDVHLESGWRKPLKGSSVTQLSCQSYNKLNSTENNNLTAGEVHLSSLTVKSSRFGQLRRERSLLGSSLAFASSEFGSSIMLPIKIEAIPTMEKEEEEEKEKEDLSLSATVTRLIKNKAMWIMCIHCFLVISSNGIHSIHFPAFVASQGVAAHYVSPFYTVYGVCIVSGRLLGGMIYNRIKPPLLTLVVIIELVQGLVLVLCPFYATSPAGIFLLQCLLAMTFGQVYMLQAPLIAQYVLVEDLSIAFGMTQLFNGIGYVTAPILAGFIYDVTNTYNVPMHIAGSSVILGAVILSTITFVRRDTKAGEQDASQDGDEEEEIDLNITNKSSEEDVKVDAKHDKDEEEVKTSKTVIREVGKV